MIFPAYLTGALISWGVLLTLMAIVPESERRWWDLPFTLLLAACWPMIIFGIIGFLIWNRWSEWSR